MFFSQTLIPEQIPAKTWSKEYTASPICFEIEENLLKFRHAYGGGKGHRFEAKILDTSTAAQRSFTILIEDLTKNDNREGKSFCDFIIQLKPYLGSQAVYKVMKATFDNSATALFQFRL